MRFFVWMIFFCLLSSSLFARPFSEIQKSGILKICHESWMGERTKKGYPGPFMEMAIIFAQSLNLKPKLVSIFWLDIFKDEKGVVRRGESYDPHLLASGQCDLYANILGQAPWREKIMKIGYIYDANMVIVVRKKDLKKYRSIEDLKNKRTTVTPHSHYHEWLKLFNKKHSDAGIEIELQNMGGHFKSLIEERADFIIFETTFALYAKHHVSKEIDIAFPIGGAIPAGWGFPKSEDELYRLSEDFLKKERLKATSPVNDVFRKYFGVSLYEFNHLQPLISNQKAH